MMRSTARGALAGLIGVALMMGVFAASNGVSEDLYAPLLVMGVPIFVIGAMAGIFVGAGQARPLPSVLVRAGALVLALMVLTTASWLMGVF